MVCHALHISARFDTAVRWTRNALKRLIHFSVAIQVCACLRADVFFRMREREGGGERSSSMLFFGG